MNANASGTGDATGDPRKNVTTVERRSERLLVVTRAFDAPARILYDAWTKPELLKRWWAPRSLGVKM